MINESFAQQGWQCPICKRVYSPFTPCCFVCGNVETVTTTGVTVTTGGTVTTPSPRSDNWGNMNDLVNDFLHMQIDPNHKDKSDGMLAEPKVDNRTCDNCKHNAGLPHNTGKMEYSGACKKCVAKDMWESDKE